MKCLFFLPDKQEQDPPLFYLRKVHKSRFFCNKLRMGDVCLSILNKWSVFVLKYKLTLVILWKPTTTLPGKLLRVIFLDFWKFYPSPKNYTNATQDISDKFHVWRGNPQVKPDSEYLCISHQCIGNQYEFKLNNEKFT